MLKLIVLFLLLGLCRADYNCLCSYDVEKPVYTAASPTAGVIGYLYEFDCKPYIKGDVGGSKTWATVAFEKQMGFVQTDQQTTIQVCPGTPPVLDALPTLQPVTTSRVPTMTQSTIRTMTESTSTMTQSTQRTSTTTQSKTNQSTSTTKQSTVPTMAQNTSITTQSTVPMTKSTSTTTPSTVTMTTQSTSTTTQSTVPTTTQSTSTTTQSTVPTTTRSTSTTTQSTIPTTTLSTSTTTQSTVPTTTKSTSTTTQSTVPTTTQSTPTTIQSTVPTTTQSTSTTTQSTVPTTTQSSSTTTQSTVPTTTRSTSTTTQSTIPTTTQSTSTTTQSTVPTTTQSTSTTTQSTIPTTTQSTSTTTQSTVPTTTQSTSTTTQSTVPTTTQSTSTMTQSTVPTTPLGTSTMAQSTKLPVINSKVTALQGDISLCPASQIQFANKYGDILAQHGNSCYTVANYKASWEHAEDICQRHSGHLLHILDKDENDFITNLLSSQFSHSVWIGLHDIDREEHFKWTSGDPVTYTNWLPGRKNNHDSHYEEDCVELIPYRNGAWDDLPCGDYPDEDHDKDWGFTKYFICEHAARIPTTTESTSTTTHSTVPTTTETTSTTAKSSSLVPMVPQSTGATATLTQTMSKGDLSLCPASQIKFANRYGDILAQYGNSCYTVANTKVSWGHAYDLCQMHSGHLLHILNKDENDFITNLLSSQFSHSVWIGLHDLDREEHFKWTSGDPVTYTNWLPGRKNNHDSHYEEDCVELIPYRNGAWDDLPCGNLPDEDHDKDWGFTKYFICEHDTIRSPGTVQPSTQVTTNAQTTIKIGPCNSNIKYNALVDGGILANTSQNCYELIKQNVTWDQAEKKCNQHGGHLAEIDDQTEQDFVQQFLLIQDPTKAVWIGLTDQQQENVFAWTSGQPAKYTNWMVNHKDDIMNQDIEDCVLLMPYNQGYWNDVPCGHWDTGEHLSGSSGTELHHFLCEYGVAPTSGPILIG